MAEEVPRIQRKYYASLHPGAQRPLTPEFVTAVQDLERALAMPVWLLIGNGSIDNNISPKVADGFYESRHELPKEPVALLVDSPGGMAKSAYQIATLLRRHCGGFTAVVPEYAKSAATLLVLGADTIVLGKDAELGPLDAQLLDPEREQQISALDEVQALERLHAFALEAVDQAMWLLADRTKKKTETLLPHALRFEAEIMRPLFENIDTIHYTQMSRILKEAEEYAVRLLTPRYPERQARAIATKLVENYPEHGFAIYASEANGFGLHTEEPSEDQAKAMDAICPHLKDVSAIGQLKEVEN